MNLTDVFLSLVDMSVAASWVALVVMAVRLALKKAPRWIIVALWVLVAIRLICPVSIESPASLMHLDGAQEAVEEMLDSYVGPSSAYWDIHEEYQMAVDAGIEPIHGGEGHYYVVTGETPTTEVSIVADYVAPVWVLGMGAMAAYTLISWLRLLKKVAPAIRLTENVFLCDYIHTPFILGVFRPKIYLPSSMDPGAAAHVLSHERAHLARHDHWWKPLGFLLLTVHWFNPLLWLAYCLLCRDIEMACDEKVVREMDIPDKKAYSEALLRCSVSRKMIAACPLAFGEVGVKERVKSVLNYKKPGFWVVLIAAMALLVAAVCLLTDPVTDRNGQRKFDLSGPNVADMDVQQIMENIRIYHGLEKNENPYINTYNDSIILRGNFDLELVHIPYFYDQDGKTWLSVAMFSDLAECCILDGLEEWETQTTHFLFEHYLNALKYLPQEEIKAMLPSAEHFRVRQIEEGTPASYENVIRYSDRGVGATDGWLIHLEVIPAYHGEDGGFHDTGEGSIHLFYGEGTPNVNGVIMDAKVLEISGNSVLVEPLPGSQELNSADKIWVPMLMDVDPIPQVGEILRITYDGRLMETYPAQIGEVFRIQVVTGEYQTESILYHVDENGIISDLQYPEDYVTYSENYVHISVPRLEGWKYEITEWQSQLTGKMLSCGIKLRPEGEDGWVALRYYSDLQMALDGCDAPEQEIRKESWPNFEVDVSREPGSDTWLYIRYKLYEDDPKFFAGTHIAWNNGADVWMQNETYYSQLMEILKNVRLAEGILLEDQALAIARSAVENGGNLDYTVYRDRGEGNATGFIQVFLYNEGMDTLWNVKVDNEGNVRSVNGQYFSRAYKYEKEGFGGHFIITLHGDGTQIYYEGALSSYIGLGYWTQEGDIVTITDGEHKNRFRLDGDALVFIAEGSTNFTYIQVEDGERFYLQTG